VNTTTLEDDRQRQVYSPHHTDMVVSVHDRILNELISQQNELPPPLPYGCHTFTLKRGLDRFACSSFPAAGAFETGPLYFRKGEMKETAEMISVRTSVRIVKDQEGDLLSKMVEIRGPVYFVKPDIPFHEAKELTYRHSLSVLFRVYVKVVSKMRQDAVRAGKIAPLYTEKEFDDTPSRNRVIRPAVPPVPEGVVLQPGYNLKDNMLKCVKVLQTMAELKEQSEREEDDNIEQESEEEAKPAKKPEVVPAAPASKKREREVEECLICNDGEAAEVLFPCGKHAACSRCVKNSWKATNRTSPGVVCPFCRSVGVKLVNKTTNIAFKLPPYRLRLTATKNYKEVEMESSDESGSESGDDDTGSRDDSSAESEEK
jgi:hypothetical protein